MRWREGPAALAEATLVIRHRGAPGDEKEIPGADVLRLGSWFLEVRGPRGEAVTIPYHRVLRISRGGAEVWRRGVAGTS